MSSSTGQTRRSQILIIDDDLAVCYILTKMLDHDYDVHVCHSADEALVLLTRNPLDSIPTIQPIAEKVAVPTIQLEPDLLATKTPDSTNSRENLSKCFDLITLDIGLPGMTSQQFLDQLYKLAITVPASEPFSNKKLLASHLPRVLIVTWDPKITELQNPLVTGVLTKPFTLNQVLEAVATSIKYCVVPISN